MCGRFVIEFPLELLKAYFKATAGHMAYSPSYNIAPSATIPVICENESRQRQFYLMRWGLIPSWHRIGSKTANTINARAETLHERPMYSKLFKTRRCLISATGFYEWRKETIKQPYYVQRKDKSPMAFAGLWDIWQNPDGRAVKSCTIITTEANGVMSRIHNRMPVILNEEEVAIWLNTDFIDTSRLQALLKPIASEAIELWPVDKHVNNPAFNESDNIQSIEK